MGNRDFLTVGDELLECAEAIADDFNQRGFSVRVEHSELNFPFTPTLVCKRKSTTVIVEVHDNVPLKRLREWTRYARSCSRDTEIALAVPTNAEIGIELVAELRELGVGVYRCSSVSTIEVTAPKDLALQLELPAKKDLPPKLKALLGSAYEKFDRSLWREGFEEACQALETEAKRYLKKHLRSGRISFLDSKGKPKPISEKRIEKMTIGALIEAFQSIQSQNRADAVISEVLVRINKDRIGVVHHKTKAATETKLRKNVGQHMWSIVAGLRAALGIGAK